MTLIFPGSFDPVTSGHIDIARRAAEFADRLIVAVLENPDKQCFFSLRERIEFLKEAFANDGIEVDSFNGLLADYVVRMNADAILRGLRGPDDFSSEQKYAAANAEISHSLGKRTETVFVSATPALSHISGTILREAAVHIYRTGLNDSFIAKNVPPSARDALRKKVTQR